MVALLLTGAAAWAQFEVNSSPNLVGSGARALGMGGAFIAVADDATAASWNPGGLTQLERPEVSLVYGFKWIEETFSSGLYPELGAEHSVAFDAINYFSIVYPVRRTFGGRNLVLSLNYQRQYDFERDLDWRISVNSASALGNLTRTVGKSSYSQRGSLGSLSPALGFEITDRLSIGAVVNLWDQDLLPDNEWKTRQTSNLRVGINGRIFPNSWYKASSGEDFKDFSGTNYTFGILYKPTERLSLGAVYHTKFTARIDYSKWTRTRPLFGFPTYSLSERPLKMTFPSAFGIGVAYRFPNDKLTLSLDVTRREWDQFVIDDPWNNRFGAKHRSGVTNLPKDQSPHDPTYTVRLGAEYVFVNEKKPRQDYLPSLRAGIFYDPEPASNRKDRWWGRGAYSLAKGDGKPDDYYGVSVGAGVLVKNRVNLDLAYIYRWGDGVRKDTYGIFRTDADVEQHTLYVSTVIYF